MVGPCRPPHVPHHRPRVVNGYRVGGRERAAADACRVGGAALSTRNRPRLPGEGDNPVTPTVTQSGETVTIQIIEAARETP